MKILIIHAWGIGDLVMFTPALKVLRERFPEAVIDVLNTYQPVVSEVLEENKTVNRIISFPWKKKNPWQIIKLIFQLRKEKYDWAIVTAWTSQIKAGILSYLIGTKKRAGTFQGRKSLFYSHQSPRDEDRSQIEQNLDILRALGLEAKESPLPFFEFGAKDRNFAKNWLAEKGLSGKKLVGFHPGAEAVHSYLFWDKDYFIELGRKIIEKYPQCALLVFGGLGEKQICQEIAGNLKERSFAVNGLSLKQVAAIIDQCQLFVSADSGVGHMAGATNTSLISLFGPSNPQRSAPRGQSVKIICQPCRHRYDENRNHTCMKKITPDRVFQEVERIMSLRG